MRMERRERRQSNPGIYKMEQKTDMVGGEGLDTRAKITGKENMIDVYI
jgi:hypothetical protein